MRMAGALALCDMMSESGTPAMVSAMSDMGEIAERDRAIATVRAVAILLQGDADTSRDGLAAHAAERLRAVAAFMEESPPRYP